MITRQHLLLLLNLFAVGVTALAVLAGFQLLASAAEDSGSGQALRWVAGGVAVFVTINFVLLVVALAIREIQRENSVSPSPPERERSLNWPSAGSIAASPPSQATPSEDSELAAVEEEIDASGEGEGEIDPELERRLGG